jgi:transposase
LVQDFHTLVRTRDKAGLEAWLTMVEASSLEEVTSFAQGLRRDRAAVDATLSLDWSNGQLYHGHGQ